MFFVLLGSLGMMCYCKYPKQKPMGDFEVFQKQMTHADVNYSTYDHEYENRAKYQAAYGIENEKMMRNVTYFNREKLDGSRRYP